MRYAHPKAFATVRLGSAPTPGAAADALVHRPGRASASRQPLVAFCASAHAGAPAHHRSGLPGRFNAFNMFNAPPEYMRTTYLVCYDVTDAKRLRKVFKTCGNFGDHLQFSVFECDLNPAEKVELETELARDYQARRRPGDFGRAWAGGRPRGPGDHRPGVAVFEAGRALLRGVSAFRGFFDILNLTASGGVARDTPPALARCNRLRMNPLRCGLETAGTSKPGNSAGSRKSRLALLRQKGLQKRDFRAHLSAAPLKLSPGCVSLMIVLEAMFHQQFPRSLERGSVEAQLLRPRPGHRPRISALT